MRKAGRRPLCHNRRVGWAPSSTTRARTGTAAALTCLLLGACEFEAGTHPPTVSKPALRPPTPSLTPVDASPICLIRRELPFGEDPLRFETLWPVNNGGVLQQPMQAVAGRDIEQCPGALPAEPSCPKGPPWTDLSPDDFFIASGSRRLVEGSIMADPRAGRRGRESAPATAAPAVVEQSVEFTAREFAAGDRRMVGDFLEKAAVRCAHAGPAVIGRRDVLVGTVPSQQRAGSAHIVVVTEPRGVVWLVVDGTPAVASSDRDRIVTAAADRLLPD